MLKHLLSILSFTVLLAACNDSEAPTAKVETAQKVAVPTGITYIADTTASVLTWKATHRGGLSPRWGTLKIKSGSVSVDDHQQLTGGSFIMAMNTIAVDSLAVTEPGKSSLDLQNHLHTADFFNVAKYPSAAFEITNVSAYDSSAQNNKLLFAGATNMVSGNLTLKDSTINVTFPAKIIVTDSVLNVETIFTIDRTQWGLNYKSKGDPQDWMISADMEVGIKLKAIKK